MAAVRVRDFPVFQRLQEQVLHVMMRLFELVEEQHRMRMLADGIGEAVALAIADISGGRTEQLRDGMPFGEFGHIELHQCFFAAEKLFCEGFCEFRLSRARRTDEQETRARTFGVGQTETRALHGFRDGAHRFRLPEHRARETLLERDELLALRTQDIGQRDARQARHRARDVLDRHGEPLGLLLFLERFDQRLALPPEPVEVGLRLGRALELLLLHGTLLFLADGVDRNVERADALHVLAGYAPRVHGRRGLVEDINRLVRKETVREIALREPHRRLDRGIFIRDGVVVFVLRFYAFEHPQHELRFRLVDFHRLIAALERGVRLDMLLELVPRRRADTADLAARERGLENVRRIERAGRGSGADEVMDLVDEQNHVRIFLRFIDQLLDARLEFAAVHRARDHEREIHGEEPSAVQRIRNVASREALRQPLDDGRFSRPRFTEKDRVVLRAAAEHLDQAVRFRLAADHGIERCDERGGREFAREYLERARLFFARRAAAQVRDLEGRLAQR